MVVAWLLESSVLVSQEEVVQPSYEMGGCECAEEEQAELGCGFVSIRYDRGPAEPITLPWNQALLDEVGGGFAYT